MAAEASEAARPAPAAEHRSEDVLHACWPASAHAASAHVAEDFREEVLGISEVEVSGLEAAATSAATCDRRKEKQ